MTVVADATPSTFEVWSLAVGAAGVLASTFVGVAALVLANRSNKQARAMHERERADAAESRRREYGSALDQWASAVLILMSVGLPKSEAQLAHQGDLPKMAVGAGDPTTSLLLAWTLTIIDKANVAIGDADALVEVMSRVTQQINDWIVNPSEVAVRITAERAENDKAKSAKGSNSDDEG